MAPRRKSVQDRLAESHARTHKLTEQALQDEVIAALKDRPDLAPRVKEFLQSAGVNFEKLAAKRGKAVTQETAEAATTGQTPKRAKLSNPKDVPVDEFDTLPPCETVLSMLKTERLKHVLFSIDDVVFTEHSVRALVPKGRRQLSKPVVLECIEFATNWPGGYLINSVRSLHYLCELAKEAAVSLGNRASRLRLPPDWARDGLHALECEGQKLWLVHRFTGRRVLVDTASRGVDDVGEVQLTNNFSENGAMLMAPKMSELVTIFFARAAALEGAGVPGDSRALVPRDGEGAETPVKAGKARSSPSTGEGLEDDLADVISPTRKDGAGQLDAPVRASPPPLPEEGLLELPAPGDLD